MSRVGKKPINVPNGIDVVINGQKIEVKGKKGSLSRVIHNSMKVEREGEVLKVVPKNGEGADSNFMGLTRSLVSNMIQGVDQGFRKSLQLVGVGYRAALAGADLKLTLGYSHPIVYKIPAGLSISVDKQTTIHVDGADKEMVGQAAANIRGFRKPEPYHGKGVRLVGERIISKVGKAGVKK